MTDEIVTPYRDTWVDSDLSDRDNAHQFPYVERVEIKFFGGLASVVGCLLDGEPRVFISSACEVLNKPRSWIGRVIKRDGDKLRTLKSAGFCGHIVSVSLGKTRAKTLSHLDFEILVKYLAFTENDGTCLSLLGSHNGFNGSVHGKRAKSDEEKLIRDALQVKLGGRKEVRTPAGRIDLLTDTHLIEVKSFRGWKSAIGQAQSYGTYYPDRIVTICLFGKSANDSEETVRDVCSHLGIHLVILD